MGIFFYSLCIAMVWGNTENIKNTILNTDLVCMALPCEVCYVVEETANSADDPKLNQQTEVTSVNVKIVYTATR